MAGKTSIIKFVLESVIQNCLFWIDMKKLTKDNKKPAKFKVIKNANLWGDQQLKNQKRKIFYLKSYLFPVFINWDLCDSFNWFSSEKKND